MKTTVETLEDNRVKLSVEVDEGEFNNAIDAAFRRIAKEVRVPGFRPGKAPRRILEAQFGHQVGREEALREAMPEYYSKAVIEHDVDVVAAPEIEVTGGQESGSLLFEATVEVRPSVDATGYDSITVEIPSPLVTDDDVNDQIDNLRRNVAELSVVDREAGDDDHVTIDIEGQHKGEPVPGLTASDYDYVVGSGAVVAEIDENLRGLAAGAEVTFSADHPDPDEDEQLSFTVLVKEVKEAVLPELDDAFADANSAFSTVEELTTDTRNRLGVMRINQARMALQQKTAEALAALVTGEISEAMIDNEINARLQDLVSRLQQQGIDVSAYLQAMGQTAESLAAEFRAPSEEAVRVDLALRSVAVLQGLVPDDAALDEALSEMAEQSGQDVDGLKARLVEVGQLSALRADLAKQAAMEWLTENVTLVDEAGAPIDRADLEYPEISPAPAKSDAAATNQDEATDAPATEDQATEEEE